MSCNLCKEWLKAAYLDLESIRYIVDVAHLSTIVSFHSQQAIEKTLKGLILSKNIKIPRVHSLQKLFEICKKDISIDDFDIVDLLDSLYIESRYPGDIGLLPNGKPTLEDAKEFYEFALDIFERVCVLLEMDQN